ncbi:hypothetical protein F503_05070 [Ophiostoma piceae UAMH 11346]|uniref:2EXR domain-containing protein n=1 Tax=Ophiostoma piceae (strain UAMH 11346) TaxID=1262450 RepID=S3D910_OPHP1|nr:hypothetical protein F503_05070 [Ophiostoma piceae UAMH 11346]
MSPACTTSKHNAYTYRPQMPCQTFPYFSQLPPELRLKIWEYNLPSCRFVSIRCGYKSQPFPQQAPTPSSGSKPRRKTSRRAPSSSSSSSSSSSASSIASTACKPAPIGLCTSTAPVPANLHVCHESRTEALCCYALMFGMARQPGRVYFDPDDDFLYFGPRDGYMAADAQLRTMLVLADQDELALVSRVALNESVFGDALIATSLPSSSAADRVAINLAVDVLHELRMRLPGLRELVIVPRNDQSLAAGASSTLVPLFLPSADMSLMYSNSYDDEYTGEYVDDFGYDGAVMLCQDGHGKSHSHRSLTELTTADIATATSETNRLSRQVLEAMRRVCASDPEWISPRWCILAMGSGPARSRHGRSKQVSHPSCPSGPSSSRSTHIPRR